MLVPNIFRSQMRLPVIVAPMFLVSGPDLIIAACRAGVSACLPALNARPTAQLDEWLTRIRREIATYQRSHPESPCSPFGVNLIAHASNARLAEDTAVVVDHKVPFVVTSLGHPGDLVQKVHAYGGLVFADVISAYHARKAAEAGVDGIIAICAGAGGHAGTQSPFALLREIREFWHGTLIMGGAVTDGYGVRAAETLGASLVYMGTRFIASQESQAPSAYKEMILAAGERDIIYTDAVSGANANFLRASLEKAGFPPERLVPGQGKAALKDLDTEATAWRDIWSAGQGAASIHDIPGVHDLVHRLEKEYLSACTLPRSGALR